MSFKNVINVIASATVGVAIATTTRKELLNGLNPEQAAAVTFGDGPMLLASCAGTGKTRALVHRVAYLVAGGINPRRILAVTFSKAGATEMNERLEKMLPNSGARIGTFHSVALQICKAELTDQANYETDNKDRYHYCVKDAMGFREINWKQGDVTLTCDFISFCKANMARPYSKEATTIAQEKYYYQYGPKADPTMLNRVYDRAEKLRHDRQLRTFDDMMIDASELLQNDESARVRWANRWDYVLQDEAQDQNKVQLVLGELLAKDHRNYVLIGDPSQAIYGFRGAMPEMLLSFEERWNATVVKMNRNYRCGQVIIDTANKVLDAMAPETRLEMHMICEKGTEGEVTCHQYNDLDAEAEGIVGQIQSLLETNVEVCSTSCCKSCIDDVKSHHAQTWPEKSQMAGWESTVQRIRQDMGSPKDLRPRTQNDCRKDARKTTEKERNRSSQKREHAGQQTRESSNNNEERTHKTTPTTQTTTNNSELASRGQNTHSCERCKNSQATHIVTSYSKVQASDISILYRVNAQSRAPEEALISARIPYIIHGGTNFYNRKEVKDLLAYLRIGAGRGDLDDVKRCINAPFRFLGTAFVKKVQEVAKDARAQARKSGKAVYWPAVIREACNASNIQNRQRVSANDWAELIVDITDKIRAQAKTTQPTEPMDDESQSTNDPWNAGKPVNLLEDILLATGYVQWLTKDEGEETTENSRVSNVRELVRASRRFPSVTELLDYIDNVQDASRKNARNNKTKNLVTLTTLHRCVHPDTIVETPNGLIPIQNIGKTGIIATSDGAQEFCNHVSYENRELVTLKTKNGYEITVTKDHCMMAWDGNSYSRRLASELSDGDFLRLRLGATIEPHALPTLPAPPDHDIRAKTYKIPAEITSDLAEFFGLMVADGTVYHNGFRLKKRHEDVRDHFADLAEQLFGCKVKRYGESPNFAAEVNSTFLSSWLLSIDGLAPNNKAVPKCILQSSTEHQAAFLRGLFEDGTSNIRNNGEKLDHVTLHTAYHDIATIVQTMLLRQEIISSRLKPQDGQWRVAIYGSHTRTYRDKIGFISSFKQNRLNLDVGPDTRNLVPVDKDWVRKNIPITDDTIYNRQNAIERGHVSRVVATEFGLHDDLHWHHDKIVSIIESTGPAMCVEVPGHGRFLQNGFDGCNSKGLEWNNVFVIGASDGILPHARCEDIEEERRLFYVGVTRAKERLSVSCVHEIAIGNRVVHKEPSPFIYDGGLEPTFVNYKKTKEIVEDTTEQPAQIGPLFDETLRNPVLGNDGPK